MTDRDTYRAMGGHSMHPMQSRRYSNVSSNRKIEPNIIFGLVNYQDFIKVKSIQFVFCSDHRINPNFFEYKKHRLQLCNFSYSSFCWASVFQICILTACFYFPWEGCRFPGPSSASTPRNGAASRIPQPMMRTPLSTNSRHLSDRFYPASGFQGGPGPPETLRLSFGPAAPFFLCGHITLLGTRNIMRQETVAQACETPVNNFFPEGGLEGSTEV